MRTIAKLFGKSPFSPLQTHMDKVSLCFSKLEKVFEALFQNHFSLVETLATELSALEHEADLTKNDIRNHLPRGMFMPIDRGQFLELLALQDALADKAEAIAKLIALKPLECSEDLNQAVHQLLIKSIEAFHDTQNIMKEIDELLEASFGGIEAEKVKSMVEKTSYKEHESDIREMTALKTLFKNADSLPYPSFYLWVRIIEDVRSIAHISERLANRIRMLLELK